MAQHTQQQNKALVDSRMRDIRRRVEVIQKKLADLQEMGVPSAFCYSSVRNTGSIFTLGDKRITDVIEQHRNEILCNLMEGKNQAEAELSSSMQEIHLILPVLPAPLDDLGRATLQSMIIGILKDLGIRWSDPKPIWWPEDIPFVPPRSAPENFAGNWIHALKRILKSVYSYFCYDTTSYIASKLESQSKNGTTSWDGVARVYCGNQSDEESDEEEDEDTDQSEEEDYDDDMDESVIDDSEKQLVERVVDTPPTTVSKSPAKLVSSFTVENILMGRQHSSSSSPSSNGSSSLPVIAAAMPSVPTAMPSVPVHSPTCTSPPAAANIQATPSCTTSSIVGVNWVSHPPVKYTKFTMLSPTAMSDEAQKKKRVSYEPSSVLNSKSFRSMDEDQETGAVVNESIVRSSSLASSSLQANYVAPANSILATRESATVAVSSSASSSAIHVYPITSLKEVSSLTNGISTATARLCPLPVVTTIPAVTSLDRKSTLSQGFPPPQQYVFLVPSNSVAVARSNHHQLPPADEISHAKRTSKSVIIGSSSANTAVLHTATSQISQNPAPSAFSRKPGIDFNPEKTSKGLSILPEANNSSFRLIAPKQDSHVSLFGSDRGSKSKAMKRTSQKPHKLRFHMTTVVTKQKREPVRGSMTVESPSAVISDMAGSSSSTSPASSADDTSDRSVAIESTITCSPNVYSTDAKSIYKSVETRSNNTAKGEERQEMERSEVTNRVEDVPADKDGMKRVSLKETADSEVVLESKTKGRATRNYTRRKRELTFHLYEDPGTAFRIKKACKE